MHDPRFLREQKDAVRAGVMRKSGAVPDQFERFYALETERLALLQEADALKQQRNQASEEVARIKKAGGDASAIIAAQKSVGDRIKQLDERLRVVEEEGEEAAAWIPNLPHESVPEGRDSSANVEVARHGAPRTYDFKPKPHWELATALGIIDFERGPKLAGGGFPLFVGDGARLVRALIDFMLDLHIEKHGYTEVHTPIVINSKSLRGTGQLPKMAEDMYRIEGEDLWLNPTAGTRARTSRWRATARPGRTTSRRSRTGSWPPRWGSSTSSAAPSSPAAASRCSSATARGWCARSSTSCSTCTSSGTATPRCTRRS